MKAENAFPETDVYNVSTHEVDVPTYNNNEHGKILKYRYHLFSIASGHHTKVTNIFLINLTIRNEKENLAIA